MDYYRKTGNVSQTCRHFDIPRKTFYYWKKRYDPSNLYTLEELSRAPKNTREKEITSQEESRIVYLRKKYLAWGRLKLQRLYQNIYQEKISSWKIQYTIQKYKLYPNPVKAEIPSDNKENSIFSKKSEFVSKTTSARNKRVQTFSIILPNLIHKSRKKNLTR